MVSLPHKKKTLKLIIRHLKQAVKENNIIK